MGMLEKLFSILEKFWVYSIFFCFVLLLLFQGYHLWQPDSYQLKMAARLGAEIKEDMGEIWVAAGKEEKLFAYLTLEVSGGQSISAIILIDGSRAGTLENGLLTLKVHDGEEVSIYNGGTTEITVEIADYPDSLDENALPGQIIAAPGNNAWGSVRFL